MKFYFQQVIASFARSCLDTIRKMRIQADLFHWLKNLVGWAVFRSVALEVTGFISDTIHTFCTSIMKTSSSEAAFAVLWDVEIVSDGDTSSDGEGEIWNVHNNQLSKCSTCIRCVRKFSVMQQTTLEINWVSSLLNSNYQFHFTNGVVRPLEALLIDSSKLRRFLRLIMIILITAIDEH